MPEFLQDPIRSNPRSSAYITPVASSGLADNRAAALAYFTIIPAIVLLVLEPYNRMPLVRFHAFQSIVFFIAASVLQVGLKIVEGFLHFIPLSGIIFAAGNFVFDVGIVAAWLLTIYKANRGQFYKLPIIGDFAAKQLHK